MSVRWILPDAVWTEGALRSGFAVAVDGDGTIAAVSPPPDDAPLERRPRQALLPGFVDVHSHAFQIGLRGRGESFPVERGSFWTWREAMYELVASLTPESLGRLSLRTFREMRRAGITTVGEFHYVHHADADAADFALDEAVVLAAREAGIRLVLLECYYRTGGPGRPLEGGQRRFDGVSVERFLAHCETIGRALDPARESLGLAPHSLRAVTPQELAGLAEVARARGLPLHIHLEEQRREVEECVAHYGKGPVELVLDTLDHRPGLSATGIHLTHTDADRLFDLFAHGWTAGLCPLTESNLGDGIPSLAEVPGRRRLALGSDSNLRISMLENLRGLEYGQRLRTERRGLLGERPAVQLLEAATAGGAASLALATGRIAAGAPADLVAIDLGHPVFADVGLDELPEALVFGAPDDVVLATAVNGRFEEHREPSRS